jgi:5-(carboxyamino)imidazole ribonucleotide synthase
MTPDPILPGATIGVLGGGQLGRMLAAVARRLGYRVHVYSDEPNSPASHFANRMFCGDFSDRKLLGEFAATIDVLTFEFENVLTEPLAEFEGRLPIRPAPHVLHITQDRIREKQFLKKKEIPLSRFHVVRSLDDLVDGIKNVGLPAVLKTAAGGYDGKGQFVIHRSDQAVEAWRSLEQRAATLEAFIDLDCEISVIVARNVDGELACYEPIRNEHARHILDVSTSPCELSHGLCNQATQIAISVAIAFDLTGLICIEFFVARDGQVLVNEIAPRPHNSGHLTIEAHATSQFEQQLRAICGLPLGSTRQVRSAAMVNLLGEMWERGEPNWEKVANCPEAYLHLYDKHPAKTGRKMGHLTVCTDNARPPKQLALSLRDSLRR